MIKTNAFFDVLDVQVFGPRPPPDAASVLAGVATTDVLGPVYQQWLSFPHFVRPSSPLHLHQSCGDVERRRCQVSRVFFFFLLVSVGGARGVTVFVFV